MTTLDSLNRRNLHKYVTLAIGVLLASALSTGCGGSNSSAVVAPDVRISLVAVGQVEHPTGMAVRAGDPTLFVTTQDGLVVALRKGAAPINVLDIASRVTSGGEEGFLGLAFSRDGSEAYVDYTDRSSDLQIEAYKVGADGMFDPASRRPVLHIAHPDSTNHHGGQLIVDANGLLYISTGDGTPPERREHNAQDLQSLLGKILRINPNPTGDAAYSVPTDNPFYGSNDARGEIWAYGLRNPWRLSFDRNTGDLWIGDVGQNDWDEVDLVRAGDGAGKGANFGWSAYEGTHRYDRLVTVSTYVKPIFEYSHFHQPGCVIGGFVYRGSAVPAMVGAYIFGDQIKGTVRSLRVDSDDRTAVAELGSVEAISSLGEDNDGELYAMSYTQGTVYRIENGA